MKFRDFLNESKINEAKLITKRFEWDEKNDSLDDAIYKVSEYEKLIQTKGTPKMKNALKKLGIFKYDDGNTYAEEVLDRVKELEDIILK